MGFPKLTIGRNPDRKPNQKTRTFSTRLLGYLTADCLWEANRAGSVLRPVWIAYFGSELETRPFTANLRGGPGQGRRDIFQIPKRAPYRWSMQKVPEASSPSPTCPSSSTSSPRALGRRRALRPRAARVVGRRAGGRSPPSSARTPPTSPGRPSSAPSSTGGRHFLSSTTCASTCSSSVRPSPPAGRMRRASGARRCFAG